MYLVVGLLQVNIQHKSRQRTAEPGLDCLGQRKHVLLCRVPPAEAHLLAGDEAMDHCPVRDSTGYDDTKQLAERIAN